MTDRSAPYLTLRIDREAVDRLGSQGLVMDLVDGSDVDAFGRWYGADARGFHDAAPSDEEIGRGARGIGDRRTTGVWDSRAAEPDVPVATAASWPAELSVPGGRSVRAWAISSVTVSPTHRRRGIARAMLEAELRSASSLGLSVAVLTVSEATIYGRYGFATAAMAATWTIDTTRTRWSGPAASGSVSFVSGARLRSDGPEVFERVLTQTPGDIERWDLLWDDLLALHEPDKAKKLRLVRYDDEHGVAQGFAVYTVRLEDSPVRSRTLTIEHLVTATDDAYAGLWRFLLEQDLIEEVVAPLRRVDEPVVWQLSDRRAIRKSSERDHLWARVLDVKGALEGRTFSAAGRVVMDVADGLGYAAGRFLLEVDDDGSATVSETSEPAGVSLTVNELGALYLGGVSGHELLRAGRMSESAGGAVAAIDAMFRSPSRPWLSIWF